MQKKQKNKKKKQKTKNNAYFILNLLDSAGDGGFIVSGLTQSDGDGDLSRLVVICPRPSKPAE